MNISVSTPARRKVLMSILLMIVLFPVGGCAGAIDRSWSEDVELDDGKVIEIKRYVKFRTTNSLAGDSFNSIDMEGALTFTGQLATLPKWNVPLTPIVLYQDQKLGEWVIVATTSNCETWYYQFGHPEPPYWEYRLRAGKWINSPLSETSIGRKANLFFDYEVPLPAKHLTIALKNQVLSSNDFAKDYLSILAEQKSNCGY